MWSCHVGDPILARNITRRVDYALFMVKALKNDALIHEAPAIVGYRTPLALAHAGARYRKNRIICYIKRNLFLAGWRSGNLLGQQ